MKDNATDIISVLAGNKDIKVGLDQTTLALLLIGLLVVIILGNFIAALIVKSV